VVQENGVSIDTSTERFDQRRHTATKPKGWRICCIPSDGLHRTVEALKAAQTLFKLAKPLKT
jgi:hypothetical protein